MDVVLPPLEMYAPSHQAQDGVGSYEAQHLPQDIGPSRPLNVSGLCKHCWRGLTDTCELCPCYW